MLWTLDKHFDKAMIAGRTLIHGHTPIPWERTQEQTNARPTNIDGGCLYASTPGFGYSVDIPLTGMQIFSATYMEKLRVQLSFCSFPG